MVEEPLPLILDYLKANLPFCHLRFNDGEYNCMFGLKGPTETNGEHCYDSSLGLELLLTFDYACRLSVWDRIAQEGGVADPRILVGSWLFEDPTHPAAAAAIHYLDKKQGFIDRVRWVEGNFWHREDLEKEGKCRGEEILALLEQLRSHWRPVVLVGSAGIRQAAGCLGATFYEVPGVDAWTRLEKVVPLNLRRMAGSGFIFVWCCGFPGKVWGWNLFSESPASSHIDAGSFFDGLCGNPSREWMKQQSGAHAEFYYQTLGPLLKKYSI